MFNIRKLTIEGFKSYGPKTNLHLKLINFLFGPNSHGKSTALSALYILCNNLLQRDFSLSKISHIDNSPDIILRDDLVNYNRESQTFKISCEIEVGDIFSRELAYDENELLLIPTFELENMEEGKLKKFSVHERYNGQEALFFEVTNDHVTINFNSNYYRDSIKVVDHSNNRINDGKPIHTGIKTYKELPIDWGKLVVPHSFFIRHRYDEETGREIVEKNPEVDDKTQEIADFLNKQIDNVFKSFRVGWIKESFGWIGPNRSIQNESFTLTNEKGFIDDRFLTIDSVNALNNWLRTTESINLDYEFVLDIGKTKAGVKKKEFGVKDVRTGKYLTLYEVGSGVAHIFQILLPFFGELHGIIIQQPEIHLHPSMQVQFAKALIELVWKFKVKMIIETHSEHIIKTAQLEIAKSLNSEDSFLNHNFFSVLYISKDRNGFSNVRRMELDKTGAFTEPWPDDFFELSADLSLERLRQSYKSKN